MLLENPAHVGSESLLRKLRNGPQVQQPKNKDSLSHLIPYMHGVSHNLNKVGERVGVSVVFTAPYKLLRLCKDTVPERQVQQQCAKKHMDPLDLQLVPLFLRRFLIAIGHILKLKDQSEFFEIGTYTNDNKLKFGNTTTHNYKCDTGHTVAVKTFYWVQFVRDAKYINVFFNGELYHKEELNPKTPVYDGITTWPNVVSQQVLCFECLFTCDKSNVSTRLPMNQWFNSDERNESRYVEQSVNFKLGGSITILGTYKKTGQGDDKIKLAFLKGSSTSNATIDPPSDRSADIMLHLTIEGGELVLTYQDNHKTLLTGVDGAHTLPVKIVENFQVISVCMTSGMVDTSCKGP
ncbi:uncharacterized protein LOC135391876 [Ornithodoros turicata]|uniref:uncharacterized protein LOC135391876 n=1 Tax=Ornithodoros turicata TaxID=34597 RepID=UPI00313980D6